MDHDHLRRRYFGNNGTRRVVVTFVKAGDPDWDLLDGGPFDWGNMSSGTLRLANAILKDLGASPEMCTRYAQKLMMNGLSYLHHERALVLDEVDILNNIGCKAIEGVK